MRQLKAESGRLTEALPGLRKEHDTLGEELDALLIRLSGSFEYQQIAGIERPRLVLPSDSERTVRRQWQDEQDRHDIAEVALTDIAPSSDLADDAVTDNDTIRWLMREEVSDDIEPTAVLGGLALSADSYRATITGEGGVEGELRRVLSGLRSLESVLRQWMELLELLRLRSGAVQRKVRQTLRGNNNYHTMSSSPMPGSFYGPRLLVWRSHHFSRALLVLTEGRIMEQDGRLSANVARRLEIAAAAAKALNGWRAEPV